MTAFQSNSIVAEMSKVFSLLHIFKQPHTNKNNLRAVKFLTVPKYGMPSPTKFTCFIFTFSILQDLNTWNWCIVGCF